MKPCKHRKAQQGFALLALAGLLLAASLATATVLVQQDRKQAWEPKIEATTSMREIEDYLVRFQRQNHRLPCPAAVNQSPDSINYGLEGVNCHLGGAISGTTRITSGGVNVRIGVLPVRTLGLPSKLANDPWGTRLTYAVVESLTNVYQFSSPYTGLTINNRAGSAVTTSAGYVIVSHGKSAEGGYNAKSGLQVATCGSANGLDQENCDNDHIFIAADSNTADGGAFYDDSITYRAVDSQAQATNNPCAPPSPPSPYTWGAACSAPYVNMLHGEGPQTLNNTTPEYTGSASVSCNNGVFTVNSSSCIHTPSCPAATESWVGSVTGCSAARGNLAHGGSQNGVANTAGGRTGSADFSCSFGVISQSNTSCTGNSCTLPWGGTIAHGASISAFQSSSVPCGSNCASEVRTCNFGVLSGSFTNQSCSAVTCNNCTAPWGATVPHNSSVTAFQSSSVACGSSCNSETRSCWNGTLSGSFGNQSCSAAACAACGLPWGGSIAHGGAVAAYNTWDAGCGGTCYGETRWCNNGSLSGSYGAASCSANCASCALPWGGSIGHGGSVAAYTQVCSSSSTTSSSGDGSGDGGMGADGGVMLDNALPDYATITIPARRSTASMQSAEYQCAIGEEHDIWQKLLVPTQGDGGDGGGWSGTTYSTCVGETRICSNGTLTGSYPYNNCGTGVVVCSSSTSGGWAGDGGDGGSSGGPGDSSGN